MATKTKKRPAGKRATRWMGRASEEYFKDCIIVRRLSFTTNEERSEAIVQENRCNPAARLYGATEAALISVAVPVSKGDDAFETTQTVHEYVVAGPAGITHRLTHFLNALMGELGTVRETDMGEAMIAVRA